VIEASWSRCGGEDCVRLGGLAPEAGVHVLPRAAAGHDGIPPMAGRVVRDGAELCFIPRFAFLEGTTYTVFVDGVGAADLIRPRPERPITSQVTGIWPTTREVPRNLLRLYVLFSAPMSEGHAARHVRLVDDHGGEIIGALLATEYELWDAGRRRLTVLLDPARIKRGLISHRQAGYPLRSGASFRLVVDDGFPDARGMPLRTGAERRYKAGGDQRGLVEPRRWTVTVPAKDSREAVQARFDRPLDHGLLARCLHVFDPEGQLVDGTPQLGPEERSWRLVPRRPWTSGTHQLVVDPVLEDLAGNSVSRLFDRDLTRPQDEPWRAEPVMITFHSP
jgi:hypothetical protein